MSEAHNVETYQVPNKYYEYVLSPPRRLNFGGVCGNALSNSIDLPAGLSIGSTPPSLI